MSKATKTSEKAHSFYNIVSLEKPFTYFPNFDSLNIVKNILPQQNETPYYFTNFPGNMFLVYVRKHIFALHHF